MGQVIERNLDDAVRAARGASGQPVMLARV
jgi:hypothetical protein